jgi:hypothetical protein
MSEESETITLTTDVTEQIKSIEDRKRVWFAEKADILLNSDNKKDLVIGLIEDFNNILGCVKEIERIVKDSLDKNDKLKFKLALRQILQMFPQKDQKEDESPKE